VKKKEKLIEKTRFFTGFAERLPIEREAFGFKVTVSI
jgi:hypothetical protein